MAKLEVIEHEAVRMLDERTFAGLGCPEHGIVVLQGARSWAAHERGSIELPLSEGTLTLPIGYDRRGGPYVLASTGSEHYDLLVSLTDEHETLACIWARKQADSPVIGVGIDLCEAERFERHEGKRDWAKLLLTAHELELADELTCSEPPAMRPFVEASFFAAKEAAFKATAAPLRRWYDTHDDPLRYEVRHFVMEELGLERGTGRNGAAQEAMDRMGIARIAVKRAYVGDMALVTAVALSS